MYAQNYMITPDPLSLDRIRGILTRLEDTIIFSVIERAQFAHNPRIYKPGAFPELLALGFDGSWLEWTLREIESFHGQRFPFCRGVFQFFDGLTPQRKRGNIPGEETSRLFLNENNQKKKPIKFKIIINVKFL